MRDSHNFEPNWISSPGDTIRDILNERALSNDWLASELGISIAESDELIHGVKEINEEIAVSLSDAIGASAKFWLLRQEQFEIDSLRINASVNVDENYNWLKKLPYADMVNLGWVPKFTKKEDKLRACLDYFGVSSFSEWNLQYQILFKTVSYRKSSTFESSVGATAAWLRYGELVGNSVECPKWDVNHFKKILPEVRKLTTVRDPSVFLPELKRICSEAGVIVGVSKTPKGCTASGATYILPNGKALLLLSFRYLSDDHFWFTFFHEAGHLVLHSDQKIFVENKADGADLRETEANEFSASILIPIRYHEEFLNLKPTKWAVSRFAKKIGIATGIVVGQLQHIGHIGPQRLNALKRRYKWENIR